MTFFVPNIIRRWFKHPVGEIIRSRKPLSMRRSSENFEFSSCGLEWTARLGFYENGRLGEVFLMAGKDGTPISTIARDSAILLSLALQNGADINGIRSALCRDEAGNAMGPVGALLDDFFARDQVTGKSEAAATMEVTDNV